MSQCTKHLVSPIGKPSRPRIVIVRPAERQRRLIELNRYPRQVIGLALRLPDGDRVHDMTPHYSLSFLWAKPARWWK